MKSASAPVAKDPSEDHVPRPVRRAAYLPVFVRRFRHVPFLRANAQLIDLSEQGVKLQFPVDLKAKPGTRFWIEVPLSLVAEGVPGAAFFLAECRWYNPSDLTLGATFRPEGEKAERMKSFLISHLAASGRLSV